MDNYFEFRMGFDAIHMNGIYFLYNFPECGGTGYLASNIEKAIPIFKIKLEEKLDDKQIPISITTENIWGSEAKKLRDGLRKELGDKFPNVSLDF